MRRAIATAALLLLAVPAEAKPAFEPRTKDNLPNVQSTSAIVVDLESGDVLYQKNADEVRKIASTGKILVALVARAHDVDLEAETEITKQDKKFSKGGARTRLRVGYSYRNKDLLRAMLIASDNRAPSALGRGAGMDADELITAVNELAGELGLKHTVFSDPSGLNGNESTAREMATAFRKAMADEVLAAVMATKRTEVASTKPKRKIIRYANTNRSLMRSKHNVLGGKTGYTDAAGYCLLIAAKIEDREVAMVFLGSQGKLTRYGDFNRVVGWIKDGMPNADKAIAAD